VERGLPARRPLIYNHTVIYRDRGYLPHFESEEATYFVTFRLAGSLPATVLEAWNFEREDIIRTARQQSRDLSKHEIEN